jgi:hypothetical protein
MENWLLLQTFYHGLSTNICETGCCSWRCFPVPYTYSSY